MSLVEQLRTAKQAKSEDARAKYFRAIRTGRPAAEILELAAAAGIKQEEVEGDAQVLEEAARLMVVAKKFPAVVAARENAVQAFEKAQQALDEAKASLEPVALHAAMQARAAEEIEREARRQVDSLRSLFGGHPELLPPDTAPACVRELNENEAASAAKEAGKRARSNRLLQARERVETAELALKAVRMGLKSSAAWGAHPAVVEEKTKEAERELAAAQAERDEAAKDRESHGD